jgi:hypothetical protein
LSNVFLNPENPFTVHFEPVVSGKTNQHHIFRVDNDVTATHCWKVKVRRRGQIVHKYFSDGRHGGSRKAFNAAKAYRDTLMAVVSDAEYAIWKRNVKRPDNKSGVVGVARYIKRYKARDGLSEYPVWEAFWHDADSKQHHRRFSVKEFGENKARRLACKARREEMAEVRQELIRRKKIYGA